MLVGSESGYKFRSEINRQVKLRNVYSAQVSSTICQECETFFTEEPQTTNDEICNELRELSHAIYAIRHMFSQQNPRSKLVSLKVAFQNESRVCNHRILMISLREHTRLEMDVDTF